MNISFVQLVSTVAIGVAFPTLTALIGILVNNGRFNTIDGRMLRMETSLGDVRERVTKVEGRLENIEARLIKVEDRLDQRLTIS